MFQTPVFLFGAATIFAVETLSSKQGSGGGERVALALLRCCVFCQKRTAQALRSSDRIKVFCAQKQNEDPSIPETEHTIGAVYMIQHPVAWMDGSLSTDDRKRINASET